MGLLDQLSGHWWAWMWPMLWQSSLLVALVGVIDLLIRRRAWPQVRYVLWLLVLVKLLLPPAWSLPTAIVPRVERGFMARLEPPWASVARGTSAGAGAATAAVPHGPPNVAGAVTPAGQSGVAAADVQRPAQTARPPIDWKVYAFVAWAVGALAFAVLLAVRSAALRRWHDRERQGQTIPPWYYQLLLKTARRLGVGRLPAIVFSDRLLTPAVCGVLRPVMYLPRDYMGNLTPEEAEHVLLHELAHLKRGDLWLHALGLLVQVVYWFNPLVALARRHVQHVREICTDMTVANVLREQTPAYRQTLLDTARRLLTESAAPGLGLLGVFEEPFHLVARLRWLEQPNWRSGPSARATAAVAAAAMVAFVLPMAGGARPPDGRPGATAAGIRGEAAATRGFVYVGPGTFTMGTPIDEPGRSADEAQHDVTLTRGYYIQATEVTNRQYAELAQWACDQGHAIATSVYVYDNLDGSREILLRVGPGSDVFFSNGAFTCINPDHPVKNMTWYGAAVYCDWLSLREQLPRAYDHVTWRCNEGNPYTAASYRLPTEAEWEYACRAGTTTAFANGPITYLGCAVLDPTLDEIGWYCANGDDWSHPVAQKPPNAWGLYDMHGNVYEWCNEWGHGRFAAKSVDPPGPVNPLGLLETTGHRVARGGNWKQGNGAELCRSGFRNWFAPLVIAPGMGCRPARTAVREERATLTGPPRMTVLSPPAPNPANPRTVIRCNLPQPTRATLAIHDVRGRLVRTLADGAMPAGEREVEWDGRDERGAPAASGVYVVSLRTAEGVVRTQRVTLAK